MPQDRKVRAREVVQGLVAALHDLVGQNDDQPDMLPLALALQDLLQTVGHPQWWVAEQWVWQVTAWEPLTLVDFMDEAREEIQEEERESIKEEVKALYDHEIKSLQSQVTYWKQKAKG